MAIKALDPIVPVWFTPHSERGADNPTQFQLRRLPGADLADVEFRRIVDDDNTVRISLTSRGVRSLLRHGLMSWRNFNDSTGAVQFNDIERDKNADRIGEALCYELAAEILRLSRLNEDDEKNSSLPPTSAPTPENSTADVAAGGGTATNETRQGSSSG